MVTLETARKSAAILEANDKCVSAALIRDLASQVESLKADADRLDWLDKLLSDGEPKRIACLPGALRNVIDNEREREQS